jgi:hypothetical protein
MHKLGLKKRGIETCSIGELNDGQVGQEPITGANDSPAQVPAQTQRFKGPTGTDRALVRFQLAEHRGAE